MKQTMAKTLSQQLADLSVRAKNAEDAIAAASNEAHEKIERRKEEARSAAAKAAEKVKQELSPLATQRLKTGPPYARKSRPILSR
jgi:predicted  nucleic acid-binding Zn-ribbon protein